MDQMRSKMKDYEAENWYFPQCLTKSKTLCWAPKICLGTKGVHPFIQCCYFLIKGDEIEKFPEKLEEYSVFLKIDDLWDIGIEDFDRFARLFDVRVEVFQPKTIAGGRELRASMVINPDAKNVIHLLNYTFSEPRHAWMAMLPDKKGHCRMSDYKYCSSCGRWIVKKFIEHSANCVKCLCGTSYTRGSNHNLKCKIAQKGVAQKRPRRQCNIFKKELNDFSISNCYFADLEAKPDKFGNFEIYAASCSDSSATSHDGNLWIGKESLDEMINKIIDDYSGVLYFFYGSGFDTFFVLKRLMRRHIEMEDIIIHNNCILSMKFKTKNGEITIRDLARFLPGSLDFNCKSFGLPIDQSKSSFDHLKIKSWEDVETHKEEVTKYLWLDVVSLREVYRRFSQQVYDSYGLLVYKFVTGSHLAYGAFTTYFEKKKIKGNFLLKTPKTDIPIMRETYRGGRVICGRPIWKSTFWNEICEKAIDATIWNKKKGCFEIDEGFMINDELYENIDDYMCYIDCNSLYPAAQVGRKYPVGEHSFVKLGGFPESEEKLRKSINNRDCKLYNKDFWMTTIAKVDVKCPKTLSVGFLMHKDEEGKIVQNLEDKKTIWYTGAELWEASKLGYQIECIYEYCTWARYENIFEDFVRETYARKKAAERDTAAYTEAKNVLNSLTGKFGQILAKFNFHYFNAEQEIDRPLIKMSEIFDEDEETLLGWSGFSEIHAEFSPYPIHLSAWILGHSKVIMSKVMRKMKAYDQTKYAPLYGDTDSLIVHNLLYNTLPDNMKGDKKLGQMKLEIDGKIIAVAVLAPKTYHIVYIDAKTKKIMSITKSKGIPHGGTPYPAFELFPAVDDEAKKFVATFLHLKERTSQKNYCTNVDVKKRCYLCFDSKTGELIHVCTKIPWDIFEGMVVGKYTVQCIFGGMIRQFNNGISLNISPDYKLRTANKSDYWMNKPPSNVDCEYPPHLPQGHEKNI